MFESMSEVTQRMKRLVSESKKCINQLFLVQCIYPRNLLLSKLKSKMEELDRLCNMVNDEIPEKQEQRQKDFTQEELSKHTGKDGNPAFVAVNGIVYDVTNNAVWAAATHFGLTAGKDLSGAFASCHVDKTILSKLISVGKLI